MLMTRRRSLTVHDVTLASAERAVIAAIDMHVPSTRTVERFGSTIRVSFSATYFGRGVTNWNVYLGIRSGHVELFPDATASAGERGHIEVSSTLDVRRALINASVPPLLLLVPMMINGLWIVAALFLVIGIPTWALLMSEAYVGTFHRTLANELDALDDEPRRGFEVV